MKVLQRLAKRQHSTVTVHATDDDRVVKMPLYSPGKTAQYKGSGVVIERVLLRKFDLWVRLEGWSHDVPASDVHIEPTFWAVERQNP